MNRNHWCANCITPPHILIKLLQSKTKAIRDSALSTLLATSRLRGEREVRALGLAFVAPAEGRRTIYDCRQRNELFSAVFARGEDDGAHGDESVNRAFDGFGVTRQFYKEVLGRDSIDGRGMRLDGYVHRGVAYNNAFWDGQQMVFGDGDGELFTDFTGSLDVIAHELAHGVTEFTANLQYHNQPGALNESMSDVFGSLVKQWSLNQTADEADWLIGGDIFTPAIEVDALRSLAAPGTAYDHPELGKDPQPAHMDDFAQLPDTDLGDWGGVHVNSGIPNKAFHLVAVALGGHAWDKAGLIWYESLLASNEVTQFQDFADTTYVKAGQIYGPTEQSVIVDAWRDVGIQITNVPVAGPQVSVSRTKQSGGGDRLAALDKALEALATQVKTLTKEVKVLKNGAQTAHA
jgi:Zn-dependent metalloprotease